MDLDTVEAFLSVKPPEDLIHPAASPVEAAFLQWAKDHDVKNPGPEVNAGRYKATHPTTGKGKTFTRMSKLASTIDDTTGLENWRNGLIVAGLQKRPALLLTATTVGGQRKAASLAAILGGDKLAADLGTAMHTGLENYLLGTGAPPPPEPYATDLRAIIQCIETLGLTTKPEWVETVVCNTTLDAMGRIDFMAECEADQEWKLPRIVDLKTGKSLDYSIVHYAGQLAGYANAQHRWTSSGYVPMPELDKEWGVLLHAPITSGTCTAVKADLKAGKEIITHCVATRKRRNGAKKLMVQLGETATAVAPDPKDTAVIDIAAVQEVVSQLEAAPTSPPALEPDATPAPGPVETLAADLAQRPLQPDASPTEAELAATHEGMAQDALEAHEARTAWVRARLRAIRDCGDPRGTQGLLKFWPEGLSMAPPWTAEQVNTLCELATALEVIDCIPFPPPDPTAPAPEVWGMAKPDLTDPLTWRQPEGQPSDPEERGRLQAIAAFLDEEHKELFKAWETAGKLGGRPWAFTEGSSVRIEAINLAALQCAMTLDDEMTRLAISAVVPGGTQLIYSTGLLFGCLSEEQARALHNYVCNVEEGHPETAQDLANRFAAQAAQQAQTQQP